jgi:protein-tyrosine-phosphatase
MVLSVVAIAVVAIQGVGVAAGETVVKINPRLATYAAARAAEFEQIPVERKAELQELADYVASRRSGGEPARLTFICTHNSRRSHMAQLWAAAAAAYYGIGDVETYSGGTESTAFNPRAVAALRRAGFEIEQGRGVGAAGGVELASVEEPVNPRYEVTLASHTEPLVCFSKVYDAAPNPTSKFCAVMVCSHADENCPIVRGASRRVVVAYVDPKAADGTPDEAATYDERCAQIAREMLYAFSQVE